MDEYINKLHNAKMESGVEAEIHAIYNKACYMTLKGLSSGRDELINTALDNLKKVVDLRPELKKSAWDDDDFKELKNKQNRRFYEIVGQECPGGTVALVVET
jgi:hypothetical protein